MSIEGLLKQKQQTQNLHCCYEISKTQKSLSFGICHCPDLQDKFLDKLNSTTSNKYIINSKLSHEISSTCKTRVLSTSLKESSYVQSGAYKLQVWENRDAELYLRILSIQTKNSTIKN